MRSSRLFQTLSALVAILGFSACGGVIEGGNVIKGDGVVESSDAEESQTRGTLTSKGYGDSLRIATFNTALVSPVFQKQVMDGSDAEEKVQKVANAILASDLDVVVLNEVFSENARDRLVAALKSRYPYYVDKLGSKLFNPGFSSCYWSMTKPEDSGLMLFSKYSLEKINISTWRKSKVAFEAFGDCSGVDCCANKGVGLVMVRTPSARLHTIAFTHLQDGDHKVRRRQMDTISRFVQRMLWLNGRTFARNEVYLLGDLNIQGQNLRDDKPMFWKAPSSEWRNYFWTPSSDYFSPGYDTWAWTTSADDLGYTSPGGGARLDYIVHDRFGMPQDGLCVQHLTLAFNGQTNSDHIAVAADVNRPAPQCNPRVARRPQAEPGLQNGNWNNKYYLGDIAYPGSMQWFRFDERGTYTFTMPALSVDKGVQLRVYQSTDLTQPLVIYDKETKEVPCPGNHEGTGKKCYAMKYHMPEPPYYVRINNMERSRTGDYLMYVHRHS
ncbi:MAG: endonuclease/exonuclease/phosphatase family protein, partial [Deltaproteobacteria bacterium]|nr:endonuclease/exonuclease/phosphatase family protein [Deltaproteobacteria bacterium]